MLLWGIYLYIVFGQSDGVTDTAPWARPVWKHTTTVGCTVAEQFFGFYDAGGPYTFRQA